MKTFLCSAVALAVFSCHFAGAIAAETSSPAQVDVFVSGKDGYHTFRIPALMVTRSGTLLAICEGRKTSSADHGDVDLVVKRSSDNGRTWGPLQLIYEEGGAEKITIGNPCPVLDEETGVVWLPFTRDNVDVLITFTDDNGESWSEPRRITDQVMKKDWNWYATGPGNGIQLRRGSHKGRLVIPCDHRVSSVADRHESSRSHVFFSDDHGRSWKLGGATDARMNECAVIELSNASLMLNMRSFRGSGKRAVSVSRDGGLTWSTPVDDDTLIEPVCQASFIRYTRGDARDKSRLLFSNPATTSGRHHLTLRMSYDEGKTWPISKLVYEGSAAYSSLAALRNGDIGLLYERDDYKKITFADISLRWLTDGNDDVIDK